MPRIPDHDRCIFVQLSPDLKDFWTLLSSVGVWMIIFQCRIQKRYNALALKSSYWQTNDPIRSKFLLLSVFTSYSGRDGHLRKSSLPLSPLPLTLLDSLTKDLCPPNPPPLVEGLARRWGLDKWLWRRCTSVPFKLEVENRVMTPLWVFHFIDHKSVEEPVGGRGVLDPCFDIGVSPRVWNPV